MIREGRGGGTTWTDSIKDGAKRYCERMRMASEEWRVNVVNLLRADDI